MRFWAAVIGIAVLLAAGGPVAADAICPSVDGAALVSETMNDTRTTLKCKYELTGTLRDVQCASRFNAGADGLWALAAERVNDAGLRVCRYDLLESHYLPKAGAVTPAAFRGAR